MASYPVIFDVQRPERFDRTQVVLRSLIIIVLAVLGGTIGWLHGIVYLAVPIVAAILISQGGAADYLKRRGGGLTNVIRWYLALYAYLILLSDRFPSEKPEETVTFDVTPGGSPSVGSALLRLIVSIPSALVLTILGLAGVVILVIAVVSVLIKENYSEDLYNFQLGIMRWQARLLGYHASLVDQYPPFALDAGHEGTPQGALSDPSPPRTAPEVPTQP
jgi:hypothetical protein